MTVAAKVAAPMRRFAGIHVAMNVIAHTETAPQEIEHEAVGLDAVLPVAGQHGFQFPQVVLAGARHQQVHPGSPMPSRVVA